MIIESIILAIFVCSLAGILFILGRKFPALNSLPQNGTIGIKKHRIILDLEVKIKDILIIRLISRLLPLAISFHSMIEYMHILPE